MKKNKMYIFFAILTIIFLFSFAALCNQCGVAAAEEEKIDVGEEEEATEEEAEEEEVAAEEEATEEEEVAEEEEEVAEEEEAEGEKEAPTISISIYEGPTYNPADGVCYYRVKATVTGNPSPDVDWSRDDSDSAWGTKKAQVNLHDPGETYTLTATATNSEGTDTDSIELSWGCEEEVEEEEEEEEEEPEVINLNVPKVTTEGGYIEQNGKINSGGGLFAGDSAAGSGYTGDRPVKGYVSFDITGLSEKTIDKATLTLNINTIYGTPDPAFGGIWVGVVDWGAEALVLSDFGLPQVGIQLFNMAGDGSITCDTATLKTQLQNAINDGKSRFQIRISCPGTISINNTWDGWSYLQAGVNLNIDYH
jgi:hypothetical protein